MYMHYIERGFSVATLAQAQSCKLIATSARYHYSLAAAIAYTYKYLHERRITSEVSRDFDLREEVKRGIDVLVHAHCIAR